MLETAARLIGGVVTPLIDQVSASSARLLRKLALFAVAGLSLVVVLITLTIALDLWIASMKGSIVGALAVAGLYFGVAAIALGMALWPPRPAKTRSDTDVGNVEAKRALDSQIDEFAAPLLGILKKFGLRKEKLAVLAGLSVAKRIGLLPLVGLAVVAGFLVGRMWRSLVSPDLVASLTESDLFAGFFNETPEKSKDQADGDEQSRDAA